ncbi:MAG: hypothetical protein R3F19_23330 [Verrucomicrobiales bacterium]
MRRFLKFALTLLLTIVLVLCALDWGMTRIHQHAKHRGIFPRLRHAKDIHYDYLVIGSSRVACHIDPSQIKEATGKSGVNLARLGCGSDEALLLTKLFLANGNHADRIFYQVDYSWEETEPMTKPLASAMPFLREELFRDHYRQWKDFPKLYYVPFLRYAQFAPEIGFRETVMALVQDSKSFEDARGFSPVNANFRGSEVFKVELKSPTNPKLEAAIALCKEHNCEPHFFTSPFFATEGTDF